jgi:glucokinase
MVILVADVGATHTRFALVENNTLHELFDKTSINITSFAAEVQTYLLHVQTKGYVPIRAAIAATGRHDTENIKHPSLPFTVSKKDLIENTSLQDVRIANDLYVVANAATSDCIAIGVGTGLGTAFKKGNTTNALEAGHLLFNPQTQKETSLSKYVSKKYQRPTQYEDIVSGRGILDVYNFVSEDTELFDASKVFSLNSSDAQETRHIFSDVLMRFCFELQTKVGVQKILFVGSVIQNNSQLIKHKDMRVSQDPNITLKSAASLFDM